MKKDFVLIPLVIAFILLSLPSFAQKEFPRDPNTNFITYVDVQEAPGTADELFGRARVFAAKNFVDATEVVMAENLQAHTIVMKGNMDMYPPEKRGLRIGGRFDFTMTVQTKDGRYRAEVTRIKHTNLSDVGDYSCGPIELEKPLGGTLFMPMKYWLQVKELAEERSLNLLQRFKTFMNTQPTDDW